MDSLEPPRRILIFSLAYYPKYVSGAEIAIREVTDRVDQSCFAFSMITLRQPGSPARERIGNVEIYRVGLGGAYLSKVLFVPLAAWKARQLHTNDPFDAIWAVMTYMLFPVVLARWLGVNLPHILTLQDGDLYERVFGRWFIRPFTPLLDHGFRTAACIHAISQSLASWPVTRGFAGEVVTIPNGADPNDLDDDAYTEDMRDELRDELGIASESVVLVNTARLEFQKAFDEVIHALPLLPKHIVLLIVGGGTQEAALRKLADALGVNERVIFAGLVPPEEVTRYRRAADMFVMPSRSEGIGIAGLSAMASRLPLIATREGGLAEYVFDSEDENEYGKTAWVVQKNDPKAIAQAVETILADPDETRTVTERARKMIEEKYRWEGIAKDMEERVFAPVVEKQ